VWSGYSLNSPRRLGQLSIPLNPDVGSELEGASQNFTKQGIEELVEPISSPKDSPKKKTTEINLDYNLESIEVDGSLEQSHINPPGHNHMAPLIEPVLRTS
jgi:hypothetical protein